jgi:adenosylcobinamide kinase/adenosylcobinamide-phosphate guanylyltransferase
MHALILGGARSGKSAFAERWLRERAAPAGPLIYLATAQVGDAEMAERIARHRADRGDGWTTIEEPLALAGRLDAGFGEAEPGGPTAGVLVDCLTLWLSNLILADRDPAPDMKALLAALRRAKAPVCLVSNEVGLGIVPDNALSRRFRDWQGRLNQAVAAEAETVVFMAAGLPMWLKRPDVDAGAG